MMYEYTPLTDEELNEMLNFELVPGPVHFKVISLEDVTSGNGNPMIALRLKCTNTGPEHQGKNGLVMHNLVFAPNTQNFIAAFFRSIGLLVAYKNKQWDSLTLLDKEGDGILKEEEFIGKNGESKKSLKINTFFAAKNKDGSSFHSGLNKDSFQELSNNQAAKDFFGS